MLRGMHWPWFGGVEMLDPSNLNPDTDLWFEVRSPLIRPSACAKIGTALLVSWKRNCLDV